MLALLLALSAASPAAAAVATAPAVTGADQPVRTAAIRPGKRCHPDLTKSKGCREILHEQTAQKDAALAQAR